MRELKGDWRDLFNGFMLALDPRKMFLALCAILLTVFGPLAVTCLVANQIDPAAVQRPMSFALHDIWNTIVQAWKVLYVGTADHPAHWTIFVPYTILFLVAVFAIWAYLGGAIARIAAYEIAKDGERIETARAERFGRKKFWSFFMSPWICAIGFLFFAFCNFAGGIVGRALDFGYVGAPIVAILLPLALVAGFIMALILLGTLAGFPLFGPAIATEGTDAFDAVSRGFSYVYSRPWHYLWYQFVSSAYGIVCIAFVILFAILLCHLGLQAGAVGFDSFGVQGPPAPPSADAPKPEWDKYYADKQQNPTKYEKHYDRFQDVANSAWSMILSERHSVRNYGWTPRAFATDPHPYGRMMALSKEIVQPDYSVDIQRLDTKWHKAAAYIVIAWLVIALGMALGYAPSYVISQQTLIYYLLRKKVDGIEMNEVFEEPEEEGLPEPAPAMSEKPAPEKQGEKPQEPAQEKPPG
ncbi:MAG: hypothetical protein HYY16_02180 [Planctomycetes bacterium]|nr:hypothetical protein [Planctomycetota bacterium]